MRSGRGAGQLAADAGWYPWLFTLQSCDFKSKINRHFVCRWTRCSAIGVSCSTFPWRST